jgi:photosystem II stability/assembly factor-like uncharacterized protein
MNTILRFLFVPVFVAGIVNSLQAQWTETNGPEGGYVLCFASSGSKIYAGTDGGGVYVSTDDGSSWTQANNGLKDLTVSAIAISGTNLFAAVENTWGGSSVHLSTNDGASWTPIGKGLPNDSNVVFQIDCFAVSPDRAGDTCVFAGVLDGGVYVSTDNGSTWVPDTVGLINMFVVSLTVKDTFLFAATFTGVYRSTVNATPWTPAAPADMDYLSVQSVVALDSSLFASGEGMNGGIYRSTNNGDSWVQVNNAMYVGPMTLLDTELLAGVRGHILRSTDRGSTWTQADLPMADVAVRAITPIGTNLFAGTYGGGVFVSTDRGADWFASNTGMKNSKVNGVAVLDSDIFAGTTAVGVFRSTDNGNTWSQANTGLLTPDIGGLAVSGSSLFAGVMFGGVFKSTDDAESWSPVGTSVPGLSNTFALAATAEYLFAGTLGPGIYRSSDEGTSWTLSNTGLTNTGVSALAASDSNLFAGTYGGGVYRSTDGGTDWFGAGLTGHFVAALALNGTNLYAKTYDAGLFVSTNYGASWTKFDSGSTGEGIVSLAADTSNLYAGSSNGVVYRPESGITWVRSPNGGLPDAFELNQNYPNPFNPTTVISYQLPSVSHVTLRIYDVLGREIATLVNEKQIAGAHAVDFNAGNFPSGVYFCRITAGGMVSTRKMVLLK